MVSLHNRRKLKVLADAIGIGHFIVANIIALVGQMYFYGTFNLQLYSKYPGLEFVFNYLDSPIYELFLAVDTYFRLNFFYGSLQRSVWQAVIAGELVIVASSLLYGLIAYLFAKFFVYLFLD